MICHGNGSAYHHCASDDVREYQSSGGCVWQLCARARKEWLADAVANGEPDYTLTEVE